MAEATLLFDELETNDLPAVCMACGRTRGVEFVPRRFVHRPLFAYGLAMMVFTKRASAEIPLCAEHGGPRLFAYQSRAWWGLRTVAIGADRITIGGVDQRFMDALDEWRDKRDRGELDDATRSETSRQRRRRVQVGRGTGGGGTALKVLLILVGVMAAFVGIGVLGMFGLMALGMLFLPKGPPMTTAAPPPAAAPAANAGQQPVDAAVALLGAAPDAGGPGAVPWAPLALAIQKQAGAALGDADLDKILTDLVSRNPRTVAAAAQRLSQAAPNAARRHEIAQALIAAITANPFPTAKDAAAEALGKWGSAEDAPTVAGLLAIRDSNTRAAAMTALAGIKDEAGAVAVAQRLSDLADRRRARQALEAMGPTAEAGVVPLVNHADLLTRMEACGVLAAVGTKESLPELQIAARDPNQVVARAAAEAMTAIQDRIKRNSHE